MTGQRAAVPPPESWPTTDEVAALLRARTKDNNGNELGVFTDVTRPSAEQVSDLIATAAQEISTELDADVPIELYGSFDYCTKLLTACLVELSFYPEQVRADRSAYPQYWEMLLRAVDALRDQISSEGESLQASGIGNLGLVRPAGRRRTGIGLGSPPQFPQLESASVNYDDVDPDTGEWLD